MVLVGVSNITIIYWNTYLSSLRCLRCCLLVPATFQMLVWIRGSSVASMHIRISPGSRLPTHTRCTYLPRGRLADSCWCSSPTTLQHTATPHYNNYYKPYRFKYNYVTVRLLVIDCRKQYTSKRVYHCGYGRLTMNRRKAVYIPIYRYARYYFSTSFTQNR